MTLSRVLRISGQRLRSLSRKDQVDEELQAELEFHFDQLVSENTAEGMAPEEARRAARRTLGNAGLLEEQCRDQRRVAWIHDLKQDVLYGLRMLRQSPAFTVIALASLGLGIGANTAILSVADSVTIEKLPIPNGDRVVLIRTYPLDNPAQTNNNTLPDYFAWKEQSRAFESMGASLADQRDLEGVNDGIPAERIAGHAFSSGLFSMLGVQPMLGRVFTGEEEQVGRPGQVIVLSHRLWQRRFGADPNILARKVRLNGVPASIIGVMPDSFQYPEDVEYWVPLPLERSHLQTARFFMVAARLKPGVTVQQAQADVDRVSAQLTLESPEGHKGWGVRVQPLRDALFGWTRGALLTLEGAVGLVLLIACANVAGLLMARNSARRPELAMRVALGARRGRIVRQLLTESLLLSLGGGMLGVVLAWLALRSVTAITPPPGATHIAPIGLNPLMLLVTLLTSVATGLVFGITPALAACNLNTPRFRRQRLRGVLVAAQIALALVLLVGSGLLMNSFLRQAGRDLHFDPAGLLAFNYKLPPADYLHPIGSYEGFPYYEIRPRPALTIERVFERLRVLPGAESAAGISFPPVNSLVLPTIPVIVEGQPRAEDEAGKNAASAAYFLVTPNFFATLKATLRGRDFGDGDTVTRPWVTIVNETAARRFWPGQDPLGKRLTLDAAPEEQPREVIGIVRDIPVRSRRTNADPVIYASFLQQPPRYSGPWANMFGQMTFVLRRAGDPMSLAPAAREAVAEIDPNHPLSAIKTMDQYIGGRMREQFDYALVLGVFAVVATVLACIGVYGAMSYAVLQRTREIGIRMALGAGTGQIVRFIGGHALVLIAAGLAAGLAGSWAAARLIASQLWGVAPTDRATFWAATLLLLVTACIACCIPARRAVKVDPVHALRVF